MERAREQGMRLRATEDHQEYVNDEFIYNHENTEICALDELTISELRSTLEFPRRVVNAQACNPPFKRGRTTQ